MSKSRVRHESSADAGVRPSKRHRPRRRIVVSLLLVLAIVGLAPLGSVAWKLIQVNREALTTSVQQLQLLLASSIAREVESRVDGVRQRMAEIAERIGQDLQAGRSPTADELGRMLDAAADSYIVYLRYAPSRGDRVSSDPNASLPEPLETTLTEHAPSGIDSVGEDGGAAGTWLSEPVITNGPGRDSLLVVAAPVRVRGRDAGTISAVVHFSSMWDQVVERNKRGQTVFVVSSSGVPFASSDPSEVLPGVDLGRSGLVQRFLSNQGRANETLPFGWTVGGLEEPYLGSYENTALGWGIVVQARAAEIYHPVRAMVASTMTWAAGALALAIVAAVVFARTLSKPIDRLAAASRAFAEGDFSRRVEVRSSNEIGELADTFNGMAGQIESHIEKLRRAAQQNHDLFLGTVRALANAIDAKDPYTRGHSVRVNRYSVIIARSMGLPKAEIERIHVASVMHDVGKIGIHDAILQKPGALTREEFEVMKTHTTRGAEIMAPIPQMKEIIPGLRSHHERWNGSGYPDGLAGEDIPLMGRVIAVADTFDAMTTQRPYQEPFSFDAAVARINELRGLAFDETVVEAFNRAYAAGEFGDGPSEVAADVNEAASVTSSQAIA